MNTTSNIIAANNADLQRMSFMVAKSHGNIHPIMLGAKLAMVSELKKRLERGEVVCFDYIKKSTGELRHATGILPKDSEFIAARINGRGVNNSVFGNFTIYSVNSGFCF